MKYELFLENHKIPLYIRTYSGDWDIFYEIFWKKTYEIPEAFSSEYKVILDLVANIGFTSIYFSLKYPKAKIYALEAEKENYNVLKQNISYSDNITPLHGAVDTKDGVVYIDSPDLSYNFSISHEKTNEKDSVQAYSMNTLMRSFGITHIDLLKIDIEGMEQSILQNNNEWLAFVDNIIIELHTPYNIKQLETDLSPFGFNVIPPDSNNSLKMIYATKNNNW